MNAINCADQSNHIAKRCEPPAGAEHGREKFEEQNQDHRHDGDVVMRSTLDDFGECDGQENKADDCSGYAFHKNRITGDGLNGYR